MVFFSVITRLPKWQVQFAATALGDLRSGKKVKKTAHLFLNHRASVWHLGRARCSGGTTTL
jgi:hypothetical protein